MIPPRQIDLLRHGETQGGSRFRGRTDDPLTPLGWRQMWVAVSRRQAVTAGGRKVFQEANAREGIAPKEIVRKDIARGEIITEETFRAWDGILTSPLARCADFGRALSRRLGIPLCLDPRLAEMDFGAWEGRTAAELMEQDGNALRRFWSDPMTYSPPGGESLPVFRDRVLSFWRDLIDPVRSPSEGQPSLPGNPIGPSGRRLGERVLIISHGGVIRVILCEMLGHPLERLLELEVGHASLLPIRREGTISHDLQHPLQREALTARLPGQPRQAMSPLGPNQPEDETQIEHGGLSWDQTQPGDETPSGGGPP
jgi:broad specificity phosphatase PhoE